ncbi:uncharacterized protein LOC132668494 [Panthera onca]
MCCCFRPEAATLGRREAASAGPGEPRAPLAGSHRPPRRTPRRSPPPGGGSSRARASAPPQPATPRSRRSRPADAQGHWLLSARFPPGKPQHEDTPAPPAFADRGPRPQERPRPRPPAAPNVPVRVPQDPTERAGPRSPGRPPTPRPGTREVTPPASRGGPLPRASLPAPRGQPPLDPRAELATPTWRRRSFWDVRRGRRARRRGGPRHLVRSPGPGRSPTPASSPRRRRRRRAVKWGRDGGRPASPAPSGRAARRWPGAQRRRARAATCTARQVHGAPGRPATSPAREPGGAGARGPRVRGPGAGRSERAGPRRRRDAAGTLLRPLPGSHSSPWAGRQAWCQEPGLPTPPPPAGALGRGGRGLASQARGAPPRPEPGGGPPSPPARRREPPRPGRPTRPDLGTDPGPRPGARSPHPRTSGCGLRERPGKGRLRARACHSPCLAVSLRSSIALGGHFQLRNREQRRQKCRKWH